MRQIICKNLSIGYDKNAIAINLSLTINKGDYLCVVGENGAGKSTFIKTILGLIPAVGGTLEFGKNFSKKEIGYLPQHTTVQKDFPATVMEVVLSGFQNKKWYRPFYLAKDKQTARENLKKLGIENLERKCFRELSGGQQQRVLLARALCSARDMLLLDEPVAGLDPKATSEMYDIIKKLNDEGVTIVMITHDVATSLEYASHILFIGEKSVYSTKDAFENSEFGHKYKHYVGGCCGHE